jgi:hypothetical protein
MGLKEPNALKFFRELHSAESAGSGTRIGCEAGDILIFYATAKGAQR